MRNYAVLFLLVCSAALYAVPSKFRLVTVSSIKTIRDVKPELLEIAFKLPCTNEDAAEFGRVIMTHDHVRADLRVAVGFVAALDSNSCTPGDETEFTAQVNPLNFGYRIQLQKIFNRLQPIFTMFQPMELQ